MRERIRRTYCYEGFKVQSWPGGSWSGNGSFSRRVMITFPNGHTVEYVDKFVRGETDTKSCPYATRELCHTANCEWGRQIIERWKQESCLSLSAI